MSHEADREFGDWMRHRTADSAELVARIDVIAARPLSRAIAAELGIRHESPQAIRLGPDLAVLWHASHGDVTREALEKDR